MQERYIYTIRRISEPLHRHRFAPNSVANEMPDIPNYGNAYLSRLRKLPKAAFEPASETINRILKYSMSTSASF